MDEWVEPDYPERLIQANIVMEKRQCRFSRVKAIGAGKNNIRFAVYGTPIGNILSNIVPRKIVVFDITTGEVFKEFNFENK